jgi:peptidyl-prolyl cis-trans isomerase D
VQAGETMTKVAADFKLEVKSAKDLMRTKSQTLPESLVDGVFKAAKPIGDKPNIFISESSTGEQVVVSLSKVKEGVMSESDKKQLDLALKNIGRAYGQSEFDSVMASLQADADVSVAAK